VKRRVFLAALLTLGVMVPAQAHRLNEYLQATTIAVSPEGVTIQVRLTPGVDIAPTVIAGIDADHDGTLSSAEAQAYADGFVRDLSLAIDGRRAPLRLQSWSLASLPGMASGQGESTVTMTAAFTSGAVAHELTLENRHQSGVAAYLVNALQPESADVRIAVQRRNYDQSQYAMAFTTGAIAAEEETSVGSSAGAIMKTYAWHGLRHILSGYDHLLFLGALVLAAATFCDLVKIVTAFTVAHSLTLTLAALNLVHLPGRIVEPLIAVSIVFVALQNVLSPQQSRGRSRLAVAFFFGLFHGLGFAGGLLELMYQMPTSVVLLGILGFSIGVEAGNQLVMVPLFAGLRLARGRQGADDSEAWLAGAFRRVGSTGISVAGSYYLLVALAQAH
jgi:hydrogenase/urease accessory protein HupE